MRKRFVIGLVLFVIAVLVLYLLYFEGIDIAECATIVTIALVAFMVIYELFRSDIPNYRRVLEIGLYLLGIGSLIIAVTFVYILYFDIELLTYFVFIALPSGVLFLAGLLLTFYGIYLKDKAGELN